MLKNALFFILVFVSSLAYSQQNLANEEELKKQILALQQNVDNIQINLSTSEKKFKRGILVATIGYAVTITGGLMLGRENDQLGQGLLVAGGITGAAGTVLMLDSFKYLGRAGRIKK
jgi:3-keto-L-gulonate-6-phosphate decarboxylase